MQSPIEIHKQLAAVNGIKNIANDVLFERYVISNDVGDKKKVSLEDTDQESLMISRNGGYPVPGFIYTFIYKPSSEDIKIIMAGKKPVKYTDHVPIVFCTNIQKGMFNGINLNVLPWQERLKFLQMYYDSYKDFFADIERMTENNRLAINKKFIKEVTSDNGKEIVATWNKAASANFSYGYRKYFMEKVVNIRMIEYVSWSYIPFLDPDNAVRGATIKRLHEEYWRTI
jgi:hypothetical protein